MKEILGKLSRGEEPNEKEISQAVHLIMHGDATQAQVSAFSPLLSSPPLERNPVR